MTLGRCSQNLSVGHMDVTGKSVYLYHPIDHYDVVCSVRKSLIWSVCAKFGRTN